MVNQTYTDYLRSEEWRKSPVRLGALRRAKYRCSLCNVRARLNVHHRTYDGFPNSDPSDVIALCDDCHENFHRLKGDIP